MSSQEKHQTLDYILQRDWSSFDSVHREAIKVAVRDWLEQKKYEWDPEGHAYYYSDSPEEMKLCGKKEALHILIKELDV